MSSADGKTTGAHKGSTGIVEMLEKVAPFLFRKKKKMEAIVKAQAALDKKVVKKSAKKPSAVHKRVARKTHAKKKRTVRHPAATLEIRKSVARPTKIVKEPIIPAPVEPEEAGGDSLSLDGDAPVAPSAAQNASESKASTAGVILLPEEEKKTDAKAVQAELSEEKDGFLGKVVKATPTGSTEARKQSGWSMLTQRISFFGHKDSAKKDATGLSAKELKNDSFLQRVQQKNPNAVVGTSVDAEELEAQNVLKKGQIAEETSAADSEDVPDFAHRATSGRHTKGRILSAADLRRETREAKEAALRVEKEVKEIKEEMRSSQKDREKDITKLDNEKAAKAEAAKAEAEAPRPITVRKQYKKKNGFQQFIAAIGHIGLGKERMHFVQNMAMMLNAGLPLIDSLKTLQMETRAKPMRKLLQRVLDAVENGSPLWRAMEAQSFFSLHALALIRIGEEAGNLAQNMEYLAAQEEKDHELKSKVKMAMIYPTIVLTIMFIIVIGLGWFVLPQLIGVLYSLNVELPFVTRMVIMFTNAFTSYGAIGVPAFMGGCVVFILLSKYTALRGVTQWVMFHIPGIGALAREATIARFGVILGGLLKAGVPVIEAMQSLVEVTPIVSYRKLYMRMLDHVAIGDSFSKSFAAIKHSQKLLPPSVQQLVITGEKSGALADIMLKIADIYDKKASETAQKLPVILEPMLLLFIGGLVGTIAFSIIVPIYSIVGNVGR